MEATTLQRMTMPQAEALARLLYGAEASIGQTILLIEKTDTFKAHSILNHVLTHMMSDQDNAYYIKERLGLEV